MITQCPSLPNPSHHPVSLTENITADVRLQSWLGLLTENVIQQDPLSQQDYTDGTTHILAGAAATVLTPCNPHGEGFLGYTYAQNWTTDGDQANLFADQWLDTYQGEDFLFPTNLLSRTHTVWGLAAAKFSTDTLETDVGVYTYYAIKRYGSQLLGGPGESATTAEVTENFVPYVFLNIDDVYKTWIYSPFLTDLNRQDPRTSYSTYSWYEVGRGEMFSVGWQHAGRFAKPYNTLVFANFEVSRQTWAILPNDRDVMTGSFSALWMPNTSWNVKPAYSYSTSTFPVGWVRVEVTPDEDSLPYANPRRDDVNRASLDLEWKWDSTKTWTAHVAWQDQQSNYSQFNTSFYSFQLEFNYFYPTFQEEWDDLRLMDLIRF